MTHANHTRHCDRQPLKLRLLAAVSDERLAFIDRVCGLLVESRYGLACIYQPITQSSSRDWSDAEAFCEMPDYFFDVTGQMHVHSLEISPKRTAIEMFDAPTINNKAHLSHFLQIRQPFRSATASARGSPGGGIRA